MEARKCALCGKTGGTPFGLLAKWARENGIKLKVQTSDYFHVMCARRVQDELKQVAAAKERM